MYGKELAGGAVEATPCEPIGDIQAALHSLSRSLKQGRLHDYLLAQSRIDADQAGPAGLYVLHAAGTRLRPTDPSDHLRIDAPTGTRKAQQLQRSGPVRPARGRLGARGTR